MKSSTIIAGALVAASQFFAALAISPDRVVVVPDKVARDAPLQSPSEQPTPGAIKPVGCYTSAGNMTAMELKTGVSSGSCTDMCKAKGYTLIALQTLTCYCGVAMPEPDKMVKDEKCNFPCVGYGSEACGSTTPKHYSIWNLGIDIDPPIYEKEEEEDKEPTSSTAAPSSTAATPPEETVVESAAPDSDSDSSDDDSSPNVAGIVAGSVVGVVAVAAAAGGLWFFMRRRRNTEIEEEHRRNAAVNAFISGSKPPGSSGSISMTDSRLDPVMAHRRMSDGSIADNEDYSRKILRVR